MNQWIFFLLLRSSEYSTAGSFDFSLETLMASGSQRSREGGVDVISSLSFYVTSALVKSGVARTFPYTCTQIDSERGRTQRRTYRRSTVGSDRWAVGGGGGVMGGHGGGGGSKSHGSSSNGNGNSNSRANSNGTAEQEGKFRCSSALCLAIYRLFGINGRISGDFKVVDESSLMHLCIKASISRYIEMAILYTRMRLCGRTSASNLCKMKGWRRETIAGAACSEKN
jgi:hypothetical protein